MFPKSKHIITKNNTSKNQLITREIVNTYNLSFLLYIIILRDVSDKNNLGQQYVPYCINNGYILSKWTVPTINC